MTLRPFVLSAVLTLVATAGSAQPSLREAFREPPLRYRLNRNIHDFPLEARGQEALIRRTLDEGWGGLAMNVPFRHYLTDEGMEATRRFCELARARGLELWLYDEQGYPSGNAGDRVIREDPSRECMGIFFISEDVPGRDVPGGDVVVEMPPGRLVQVVAFPLRDGRMDLTSPRDLRAHVVGSQLRWTAPPGDWRVFAASKDVLYEGFQAHDSGGGKLGARYPSLLISGVTRDFLRITHERYAEHLGKDLGRYFVSTFTDEPSLMALQFHRYPHRHALIPWQEILSVEIERRHGYRAEEKLVELYFDEGPTGQEVRYRYFRAVTDLLTTSYFGAIRDWCEAHGIRSGGHLLLEESLVAHVPLYGSIMECFRAMDAPGVDILSCYPENMPIHTPKLASSAAELEGHDLVMSEPCPVADRRPGLTETPAASVRGHLNMLLQAGVTDFNCYLRLDDFDRAGKNEINTYVGRIHLLLRGGHTASDVGVVYPIESLWTRYTPRYHKVSGWKAVNGATEAVNAIDRTFQAVSRLLFERRWEYTHLDAKALIDGQVRDGVLVHDPLRFRVIVLPLVSTLPAKAWGRLLEFGRRGGKLVAIGELPRNSDVRFPDPDVEKPFAELFRTRPNAVLLPDWSPDALDALLRGWLERPVRLEDETLPLRLAHRRVDGRDVFFLMNDSKESVRTRVSFSTTRELEEWDPASGEIRPVSSPLDVELKAYHGKVYRTAPE